MGKRGGNGAKASGKFSWDWKARHILTDRFVLADFAKIMGIAGGGLTILVGSVVLFQGDWDAAWRVAVFALAMTCVVALLFLLIMLIIGGKFRYCFEIDDKAVTFTMLSGFVKSGNRLAVILGALARSPGTVGAGLLAKSEEYNRLAFKDISRIRYYPNDNVVFLRARYNLKPIRLYCPPELYDEAADRIRRGFEAGKALREIEDLTLGPSLVPRRIKARLAALAASSLILAAPLDAPPALALALSAMAAGAIWIPSAGKSLGSLLSLGSLAVGLFLARFLTTVNVTTTEAEFRAYAVSKGVRLNEAVLDNSLLGNFAPYETFNPEHWALFGLAILGVLVLMSLGLAAYRGGFDRKAPGKAGEKA